MYSYKVQMGGLCMLLPPIPVANIIYTTGSKYGKQVTALGSGNNMVVLPDADLEQAANALLGAIYGVASQRCMAMPVGEETDNKLSEKWLEQDNESASSFAFPSNH